MNDDTQTPDQLPGPVDNQIDVERPSAVQLDEMLAPHAEETSADAPDTARDPDVDGEVLDVVAAALADARAMVARTPQRHVRRDRDAARRTRNENLRGRGEGPNRGGYSGPAADPRDPQRVGSLLGGYIDERGWDRPLAQARVFAEWSVLVGTDVAAHCTPQLLAEGELRIAAESTAWATQLRLLSSTLLARLVAELGPEVVTKLRISGPSAPSWKHGNRAVHGARGPRDTYG